MPLCIRSNRFRDAPCLVLSPFRCEQVESAAVRNRSPSLPRQTLFWANKCKQVSYPAAGGESSPNVTVVVRNSRHFSYHEDQVRISCTIAGNETSERSDGIYRVRYDSATN
jgi:hypothetical protein